MIGKKRQYNGYDFSDATQKSHQREHGRSIAIQDNDKTVEGRTAFEDNQNGPGTIASQTLASGRFFNFTAIISGATKTLRGEAWEKLNEIVRFRHGGAGEYFKLSRETDHGQKRRVNAKVTKMPTPSSGLGDPQIRVTFQLFAQEGFFYGEERKIMTGRLGSIGGMSLPTTLPTGSVSSVGGIAVNNLGNANAYCKIQVVGGCINPKVVNVTNQSKLRITATTTNLVIDNVDGIQVITDKGINIKHKRNSGTEILLTPGINNVVVISDVYDPDVVVYISRYDTFIAS